MHDHAQQRGSGPQRDEAHAQDVRAAAVLGAVPLAGLAGHTDEPVQRRLAVGNALDPAEAEADEIARRVMERLREDGTGPGSLASHAGHDRATISRSVSPEGGDREVVGPAGGDLPSGVEQDIDRHRGSGRPMPETLRRRMEGAFGADFSGVRLHAGEHARALNDSMQAAAFTAGKDIFFRDGMPRADSAGDQMLLAHELTHTVQQGDSPVLRTLRETDPETVRQAAAPAGDPPIRRWGIGKKKTKPDDEKAATKKTASKKTGKKTPKKSGKKATTTASTPKQSTSAPPRKTAGSTPPTTAGWTSAKRPGGAGTGGATIGGHRGTWKSATPGDERKRGATIGGHRNRPQQDTPVYNNLEEFEGGETESKDTAHYNNFGDFEGAYSGGTPQYNNDELKETAAEEPHYNNLEEFEGGETESTGIKGAYAYQVDGEGPSHGDQKYVTDEEIATMGLGEHDDEESESDLSDSEGGQHPIPGVTFYSPQGSVSPPAIEQKYATDEEIANMEVGEDLDDDSDSDWSDSEDEDLLDATTGETGNDQEQGGTSGPTDEKAESPIAGTGPAPTDKRQARNLAQLKEEYEVERTQQRHDLLDAIRAQCNVIAAYYSGMQAVRALSPDDGKGLQSALAAMPQGLRNLLVNKDHGEVLAEMTKRHADKMEFVKRQNLPISEKGELGDISKRMVKYDETPEAQKQTEIKVEGGLLKRADGRPADTKDSSTFHSGNGVEIFVVGPSGDIHMASHRISEYHHSSLLAGGNISMGGEMKVTNGKIDWMSNKSGHYQPSTVHFVQFLHQLEKAGVSLDFDVKGWGVPEGNTAEEFLDDLDEEDTYEFVKTKTVWKGFVDEFGKDAVKDVIRSQGWKANGSKGTEVTDADGNDVSMEEVRKLLKEKFGRGKSRLVQAPSSTPGSTKQKSWV